jgi:uncharacterized RDD family membrane protein YckC
MTTTTELSSVKRRFCAYLIDTAILLIPTLLITILLENYKLVLSLSYICLNCTYFTYFISSKFQATPGQQLMSICTISVANSKIDLKLAFERSISQFFLPLLNNITIILIGLVKDQDVLVNIFSTLMVSIILLTLCWYLVACLTKKKQTFHDMLFDTVVVKND